MPTISEWKLIDMIESSTLTIEQLLEDESIVSIARNNNTKLIDYILEPPNLHELLSYLITYPEDYSEKCDKRNQVSQFNKYPFIVCELLTCDVEPIMNKLLGIPVISVTDTDTIPDNSPAYSDNEYKNINFTSAIEDKAADGSENPINGDRLTVLEQNSYSNKSPTAADNNDENINGKAEERISPNESPNYSSLLGTIPEITLNKTQTPAMLNSFHSEDNPNEATERSFPAPMEFLLGFFSNPAPLNPTMCGYVTKILKNLYVNKPTQLAELLCNSLFPQFKKVLGHLYNDSLCEFLNLFIKMENLGISKEPIQSAKRSEIILLLVNSFSAPLCKKAMPEDLGAEYLENISGLLSNWLSSYKNMNDGVELLKPLSRGVYLNPLAFLLEKAGNAQLRAISKYLTAFCTFFRDMNTAEETDTIHDSPLSTNGGLPDSMSLNISNFHSLSNSNNNTAQKGNATAENDLVLTEIGRIASRALDALKTNEEHPSTALFPGGYSVNLVGQQRYYVVEMLASIIKLDSVSIEKKLISGKFYETLLDLFKQQCWNNILHVVLCKTLTFVIESRSFELSKIALFNRADILGFILYEVENSTYTHPSKQGATIKKGYIAHMMKLANILNNGEDERIKTCIRDSSVKTQWQAFCDGALRSYNNINNTKIGGSDPRNNEFAEDLHSVLGPISYVVTDHGSYNESENSNTELKPEHSEPEPLQEARSEESSNSRGSEDKMDIEEEGIPNERMEGDHTNEPGYTEQPEEFHDESTIHYPFDSNGKEHLWSDLAPATVAKNETIDPQIFNPEPKCLAPDLWHDGGSDHILFENGKNKEISNTSSNGVTAESSDESSGAHSVDSSNGNGGQAQPSFDELKSHLA